MNLRLDRFATVNLMYPLKRRWPSVGGGVPVLMYHSISEPDETHLHPYFRTTTSPSVFAEQMRYLHDHGYQTFSLEEVVDDLTNGASRSVKRVAITFDDGYRDFAENAFPVLNRYGLRATMFLTTSYIGNQTLRFKGKECLTWPEVRELHTAGIWFGSHTATHPQLNTLNPSQVQQEIVISKQTIEDRLGCPVQSFAYPYAFPVTRPEFKRCLREVLAEAGYKHGVCTVLGRADAASDIFFLERLPVNSCDDLRLFEAKLAGAYDWVATPQYLLKWAKSRMGSPLSRQ